MFYPPQLSGTNRGGGCQSAPFDQRIGECSRPDVDPACAGRARDFFERGNDPAVDIRGRGDFCPTNYLAIANQHRVGVGAYHVYSGNQLHEIPGSRGSKVDRHRLTSTGRWLTTPPARFRRAAPRPFS